MKAFQFDPATYSKKDIFIGGISTYLYNTEALIPYVEKFNESVKHHDNNVSRNQFNELPVNVVYLLHQRCGDYKFTESIAYTILKQYYEKKEQKVPLICVTFDNRNHGARKVDDLKNSSWKSGNDTHALDMISMIDGIIDDTKLIMTYLPSYLNLEYHLCDQAKVHHNTTIKFSNILSGYSLGGHTVIRFANKYPDLVDIINPVVGCNDLSSLLINRLFNSELDSPNFDKRWFYFDYNELMLTDDQKKSIYPEAFHNYICQEDGEIFDNFPFSKIKMFASFGEKDTLVPPRLSKVWVDFYTNTNSSTGVFIQEDVGHDVTPEMVDKFTTWLVEHT